MSADQAALAPEEFRREAFLALALAQVLKGVIPGEARRPLHRPEPSPPSGDSEPDWLVLIERGTLLQKALAVLALQPEGSGGLTPSEIAGLLEADFAQRGIHRSNVSRDLRPGVPRLLSRTRAKERGGFAYRLTATGRQHLREESKRLEEQ